MLPSSTKSPRPAQVSTLFKDHSFCLRISDSAKSSFDKKSWIRKVKDNGGRIVSPPVFSPRTITFLATDIKRTELVNFYSTSTLVKLTIVSLEYVDHQLELRQQVLDSRAKRQDPSPPVPLPQEASTSSSSCKSQKRLRSPSPSHQDQEDHPRPSSRPRFKSPLPIVASGSSSKATVLPPPFLSSTYDPTYRPSEEELAYLIDYANRIVSPRILAIVNRTLAKRRRLGLDNLVHQPPPISSSSSTRHTPSEIAAALNLVSASSASSSSTPRILLPPHPSLKGEKAAYFNPLLPQPYFKAGVVLEEPSARRDARGVVQDPVGQWGFPREMVDKFPALRKRNFFVIQWHQATALHFDLRLQCAYSSTNEGDANFIRLPKGHPLNPGTISFAISKGVHGMPLDDYDSATKNGRYAAQTNLHPISYTTYEGADGRRLSSDVMCGTLLWDVGTYTVINKNDDPDSDDESDDDEGSDHQERLLMEGMMKRSFEIILHGHHKVKSLTLQFSRTGVKADSRGRLKPEWIFKRTDRGGKAVEVNAGGSDYATGARSCLTGRTLKEVCESSAEKWAPWLEELGMGLEVE